MVDVDPPPLSKEDDQGDSAEPTFFQTGTGIFACIIVSLLVVVFVGLFVYLIYDLVANNGEFRVHQRGDAIISPLADQASAPRRSGNWIYVTTAKLLDAQSISLYTSTSPTLEEEADLHYMVLNFTNADTQTHTCSPVWSSVELSCCCFVDRIDKMFCQDDDPLQMTYLDDLNQLKDWSFSLACDLLYPGSAATRGDNETKDIAPPPPPHLPWIYLGLSKDYISYNKNQLPLTKNECTLKIRLLCTY
jgi:hypothetical protein